MADLSLKHIDGGQAFDFGRTAADYARYRDIYPESLYRKLAAFGVVRPGAKILDVGTGSGVLPRHLAGCGADFYATDLSAGQIEEARRLSAGMAIRYAVAPAEHCPFDGVDFDAVTACQCFWYFRIPEFLAELRRILRPGGRFCRITMSFLPQESRIMAATERLVLRFNPRWASGGYRVEAFRQPAWSEADFELETYHSWREELPFTADTWCGRMRSCRGVGATLPPQQVARFDAALHRYLGRSCGAEFGIVHFIEVEVYRRKPAPAPGAAARA